MGMKRKKGVTFLIIASLFLVGIFLIFNSLEKVNLSPEKCRSVSGESEKDNCLLESANEAADIEDNEQKAAKICRNIKDTQKHDECLAEVAFKDYKTCLAMKTKSASPEEWFLDCALFVTDSIELCSERLNNPSWIRYLEECIEDNAEKIEDCEKITDAKRREICEGHFA